MSNSIALRKKYRMKRHSDGVISEKANAILQKVISAFQKLIVKLLKKVVDYLNGSLKKDLERVQAITNTQGVIGPKEFTELGKRLGNAKKTAERVVTLNEKIMNITLDAQRRCDAVVKA